MAAAFMLGASGVQIGTRFLVAKECNVHENYKQKIIKAKDIDTVTTGNLTGHPVRVLRNKLTRSYDELEKRNASAEEFENLGRGALRKAVVLGDMDNGSIMSGQIAGLIKKEEREKEIIEDIYNGFLEKMKSADGLIK